MDKFRWYDWIVIFLMSDMIAAFIVAIILGAFELVLMMPLFVLSWLSYEDFRVRQENGEDRY